MKAVLYAVKRELGWEARLSIAWQADCSYWTCPDMRREMERSWGAIPTDAERRDAARGCPGGAREAHSYELMRLKELLPLGIVLMARDRLNAQWEKGGSEAPHDMLIAAVCWAAALVGESESGILRNHREAVVCVKSDSPGEYSLTLVNQARQAAARLRGCGLLLAEAMAALEADEAALLPALQLASLLGGVRLAAAVAPETRKAAAFRWRSGMTARMRCSRCGGREAQLRRTPCASCGREHCAYCEACLTMGRSRECGLLIIGAPAKVAADGADEQSSDRQLAHTSDKPSDSCTARTPSFQRQQSSGPGSMSAAEASSDLGTPLQSLPAVPGCKPSSALRISAKWGLSPAQQEAAGIALDFLLKHQQAATINPATARRNGRHRILRFITPRAGEREREFLLWAVTGAGKTEMMFPLIDAILSTGGKVAVATPRRDVVLELAPRLAVAFPHVRRAVLYGGSEDRFVLGDLTLATTHQLIRFKGAFDLVVIDEVDAFPFHNDPALHYAAAEARARGGMTLLLSATPAVGDATQGAAGTIAARPRRRAPSSAPAACAHAAGHPAVVAVGCFICRVEW